MFSKGFQKVAVLVTNLTPEQYYDIVGEKDSLTGAAAGSLAGAAAGLKKGPKGSKGKYGLIGHAAGAVAGGVAGHFGGKAVRNYQKRRVHHMHESLNLRSTPVKAQHEED